MKNLIFDFFKASEKDRSITKAQRAFEQAGAVVTSVDVDAKVKRAANVSYRDVHFGFADSQTVSFAVKETGDVFQVKINGRLTPLKNQDDHLAAIGELVGAMAKGRAKFQAALAKVRVDLPKTIRTAAPRIEATLRDQIAAVDEAIDAAKTRLAELQPAN